VNGLLQDLRHSTRQLLKRPVWTLAIVVVLAIGIGANSVMFSGFETWVRRPLDFGDPERLVALVETRPELAQRRLPTSAPNLVDWAERQRTLAGIAAFRRHMFNLNDPVEPARVHGARVSAGLFPLLGKHPVLGRAFLAADDAPGQPGAVALISDELWRERFGGDPGVLGRTLRLDGRPHEIVGVMEAGFLFPEWAEVWTPLGLEADPGERSHRQLHAIARLRPEATVAAAQQDLQRIAERLEGEFPETNRGFGVQVLTLREYFVPEAVRVALGASLGSGLFVLLIICANVSSLMLARATTRRRETAIRAALGASRGRLVRQSLVEGLVLGLLGGVVGAGLGILGIRASLAWIPVDPPYLFTISFDARAGVSTLAFSLLAGLACGAAPVLKGSGGRLTEALGSGGSTTSEGRSSARLRRTLVAGELALSCALLVGALLAVKSFLALRSAERGYRTTGILTAELSLSDAAGATETAQRLLAELERLPGVQRAGLTSALPVSDSYRTWDLVAQDRDQGIGSEVTTAVQSVTDGYRHTLDIPLLAGRDLSRAEVREGADVALVSEQLALRLWGHDEPVGRRLRPRQGDPDAWLTVVGVVGDVDHGRDMTSFGDLPEVQLYVPYGRLPSPVLALAVQSDRPPADVAGQIRDAVRTGAPGEPLGEVVSLEQAIFRVRWVSEYFSKQLTLYAVLATLIAAVGLYGLTADAVARRARELAIRMALGARRRAIVGMVVAESLRLGSIGIAVGLLMGVGAARLSAQMLPLVNGRDPSVVAGVGLLLLAISLVAAAIPAVSASSPDPNAVLRAE
jgi:predicted permease